MIRKRQKKSSEVNIETDHFYHTGLYLRLSDKDTNREKAYSDSIENQRTFLMDYLKDKPDFYLTEVYIDDGKTGSNFKRDGFQRMIEDIKSRKINCVAVKDLSRLGRNFYETGALLETVFPFYGVRFIAVTDGFDSEKSSLEDYRFHIPIQNFINESYVKDVSEKIRSARGSMAQRGKVPYSNVPYGYQKSDQNKYKMEIDEEAAEIVKRIFYQFENGKSRNTIAKELNQKKILSPSQYKQKKGKKTPYPENSLWGEAMIKRILENPIYMGTSVFGRTKPIKARGKNVPLPSKDWIIVENTHLPIISKEQFERVQKLNKKSLELYEKEIVFERKPMTENVFRGILYCGDCKKRMRRERTKKKNQDIYYFECRNYENGGDCSKKYINEDYFKKMLFQYIQKQIQLAERLKYEQNRNKFEMEGKKIEQKTVKITMQLNQIYQDYKDGMLDKESFFTLKEKYHAEKQKYVSEKEEIEKIEKLKVKEQESLEYILNYKKDVRLSRELIQGLIEKIEVYSGNRIKIIVRYGDLFQKLGHEKEDEENAE